MQVINRHMRAYAATDTFGPCREHRHKKYWIGASATALGMVAWLLTAGTAHASIIFSGDVAPDPTTVLPGQNLFVGDTAVGTVDIDGGSTVTNTTGVLGRNAGGNGTVTVSGTGSNWTNSSHLVVGNNDTGRLDVLASGSVNSQTGAVGNLSGSNGAVTVSGAGSAWTNTNGVTVGGGGTGTVDVLAGGTVDNTSSTQIGRDTGSDGRVTVSGAGSKYADNRSLSVGNFGTGRLDILAGGTFSNKGGSMGLSPGSNGSVTVSGAGSTWTNHSSVVIGNSGTGTLNVANGGVVSTRSGLTLGLNLGSVGTLAFGIGDDGTGTVASGRVDVRGTMSSGAGTSIFDLIVDPGVSLNIGDMFTLVDYGTLGTGFAFSNIADDALFTTGAFTFLIDYNKPIGTGDFALGATLTAIASTGVAEPAPASVLALGVAGLVLLRRRRARSAQGQPG